MGLRLMHGLRSVCLAEPVNARTVHVKLMVCMHQRTCHSGSTDHPRMRVQATIYRRG